MVAVGLTRNLSSAGPSAPTQAAAITDDRPYIENEEPQPQVVFAFGLRMTNCAPLSDSV